MVWVRPCRIYSGPNHVGGAKVSEVSGWHLALGPAKGYISAEGRTVVFLGVWIVEVS